MDAIDLLKEEKDYKSAISASALFWAVSSILVLILKPIGIFSSYVDALPFVIVISWLAGEIAIRVPKRLPIAYCPEHGWRILPDYPLSRFWMRSAVNNCMKCGRKLIIRCDRNNHLLSVYSVNELPDKKNAAINCSRCGDRIGEKPSVTDYRALISYMASESRNPESRIGDIHTYKKWKKNMPWRGFPYPSEKERQRRQQIIFLKELRTIVKRTEFDLLLSPAFDDVIENLDKYQEPYIRKSHGSDWARKRVNYERLERYGSEIAGLSPEEFKVEVEKKYREERERLMKKIRGEE